MRQTDFGTNSGDEKDHNTMAKDVGALELRDLPAMVLIPKTRIVTTASGKSAKSAMKDFYELEDWKQCELLFELIERISANDVSSLEQLSKKQGKAPQVIWREMCLSRGIELCNIPERAFGSGHSQTSR